VARSIRIEFEGALCHAMARKNEAVLAAKFRKMACIDENLTLTPFPKLFITDWRFVLSYPR